ncbi:MAG TPA: DUF6265 family protein, partial [Longimicrobiales bacterium]
MLNARAVSLATLFGTVLQVAMVVAGHYSPGVTRLFAVGGMGFSLLAGLVYGVLVPRGRWGGIVLGGVLAGAACAFLGILLSRTLGDVPTSLLLLGTCSSAVTGGLGGALSRLFRRGPAGAAAALLAFLAVGMPAQAQQATSARATTADFAWLGGHWQGDMASTGGSAEIVFTPPAAGTMAGVMRLVIGGKVAVVELITLVDTPEGVELRFRHFSPELKAYETDYRQTMRLKALDGARATFENLVPYEAGVMSTQPRLSAFVREGEDAFVSHSDIMGEG